MHVRHLDAYTGAWTEIQTDVVPSFGGLDVAVLNQRIAYLHTTPDVDGGVTQHVTVLGTSGVDSSATKVKALNDVTIPASNYTAVGLIGTPDPNKAGGTIDVVLVEDQLKNGCTRNDAGEPFCEVRLARILVGDAVGALQGTNGDSVGSYRRADKTGFGGIAWAADRRAMGDTTLLNDLLAFPPDDVTVPSARGSLAEYAPRGTNHLLRPRRPTSHREHSNRSAARTSARSRSRSASGSLSPPPSRQTRNFSPFQCGAEKNSCSPS